MWLGMLFHEEGDERPEDDFQAVLVYQPDRILVAAGPTGGTTNAMVTLRAAAGRAGPRSTGLPRCGQCGADLGMPDLDGAESACASS